jgi:exosortase C (VPDSG-CTERM-specific)
MIGPAVVDAPSLLGNLSRPERQRIGRFVVFVLLTALVFSSPLLRLFRHATQNELHSHIPLVPLIVAYLLYMRRLRPVASFQRSPGGAVLLAGIGLAAMAAAVVFRGSLSPNDDLGLTSLAFVTVIAAGGFLFLGSQWMRAAAFPMAFLIFMVPMPDGMAASLENASMLASADVSAWFIKVSGTPILRDGTLFQLPGIAIRVAEECSGIRSSWVLFITSLLVSNLFLKSPWRRVVLVAFVIPLGIVRNGFRILVIALLCVHVGPHMADSVIHHQGGPLFFALSLGPLFLVLWWLRRRDS